MNPSPIAIVGLAGLFPGAADLDSYWANLLAGVDSSSDVPPGRWQLTVDDALDPEIGAVDHVYSTRGYFLDAVPQEPEWPELDLTVHLAIHLAKSAWADARTSHLDPVRCGVILGHIALPTDDVSRLAREILEPMFAGHGVHQSHDPTWRRLVAGLPAVLAARSLGLRRGLAIDAACASSLYAVKYAVDELQSGRADAMIAGGLSRPDCLYTQMGFAQLRALSRSGVCRPFDAAADGLVVGEGGAAFVLKRLADAERDGDTVHAVIAGIGLSNDREGNLLAPASEGQMRAIREAHRAAGWPADAADFVECHATGTPLGDAVELDTLRQSRAGSSKRCPLGAAKANVGHLLTGAGAAGIMKTILALRHGIIPPAANFHAGAPGLTGPLFVPTDPMPWDVAAPRRAAVNAFGFGGINAQLLLEQYDPGPRAKGVRVPTSKPPAVAITGLASLAAGPAVEVPISRFSIPPREFAAMMPQQLLTLLAARTALDDAGIDRPADPLRCGVFVGGGLDLHTTDFHFRWSRPHDERDAAGPPLTPEGVLGHLASITASRIARAIGAGGPSFFLSSESLSGLDALDFAIGSLERGEIDLAVVGVADTPNDVRRGEDEAPTAIAMILERTETATKRGGRPYAVIATSERGGCRESQGPKPTSLLLPLQQLHAAATALERGLVPNSDLNDELPQCMVTDRVTDDSSWSVDAVGPTGETAGVTLRPWFSPPAPLQRLSPAHGVAFVFPGAGTWYHDMGQAIAAAFPSVMARQMAENQRLASQYVTDVFWHNLRQPRPSDVLLGQVSFATLITDLLAEFGLAPSAVIGHSLGWTAGLFATRAWLDRDEMLRRVSTSRLFKDELAGSLAAVRRPWGLAEGAPVDWLTVVLTVNEARVRARLGDHCYLLMVNSPGECVVGGRRDAVERLAAELNVGFLPVEGVTVAHCPIVREVERSYLELHLLPTTAPADVTYYHPVSGEAFVPDRDSAAAAVLAQALDTVNFATIIESAYRDGIRTFVEIGPGNSCTRLIQRILEDRPHQAIALCPGSGDELADFRGGVAELAALGLPVREPTQPTRPRPPVGPTIRVEVHSAPFTATEVQPAVVVTDAPTGFSGLVNARGAVAAAHEQFLTLALNTERAVTTLLEQQREWFQRLEISDDATEPTVFWSRGQCLSFATGQVGPLLGPAYSEIDSFPTRVRLPDEPLMLVDRIVSVAGEPLSLAHGRVVTEHDVSADRWYLDHGRMPTCIAVEAGQADLFLSGYLGIDLRTRGLAVYRLLDAVVTFHRELPRAGAVVRYDIHIDRFERQGQTHLFRFRFEGTVDGEPLLTMTQGCAGFFTAEALAAGQGIVQTALDRRPDPRRLPADWVALAPFDTVESYSDAQIDALQNGNLAACFGRCFENLHLETPTRLPGGRMRLVHRVTLLDPHSGRFGLGLIRGEADVHPDDWYLTCHFVDDQVMPGTLMYECCLHTLRVFLMRLGWVGPHECVSWEPVPGIASRLKCRGQVISSTRKATYEVTVKELGYRPEPYALADVLMYADGKPIVEITNMSVRLAGTDRQSLLELWSDAMATPAPPAKRPAALFDTDRILAFAVGRPSEAFGEPYKVFDSQRVIARLPGPPYQFLDRIVAIEAAPWVMKSGGEIIAEYDVPPDAWYFAAARRPVMPFAILLEVALQPCGWLAAYIGSALTSDIDLSFRNLGGRAVQYQVVTPATGTLATRVKITNVATSGGMIIQHYEFAMSDMSGRPVYEGTTYFGFFTKAALAAQVGIRDAVPFAEVLPGARFPFPAAAPFPERQLAMLDDITSYQPQGGPAGLGLIRGEKAVNADEWFFAAHFHQDPVMPGSLGLEAFVQLLQVDTHRRWGTSSDFQCPGLGGPHEWVYRGQVLPNHGVLSVQAEVTAARPGEKCLTADGYLSVDGRVIYKMNGFTARG